MAKLISISLLDEEISYERLMEALNKLSSRDLRKYFKRKKMVFPRNIRYAFLSKCIKRDFQAVQKDLLNSDSRVFTEFELVEFYRCVENPTLAQEFKKDFLVDFVKRTYKNLLTEKNLADLYEIAAVKEEVAVESIYGFLVGLNPIFTDTEENNLDCLPVETTAQRIKDQFTLFEVREFAKKYGVVVPKYPNVDLVAPVIIEKAEARQLLDEAGLADLQEAEASTLLSFAKKNGIYAPRYLKKDEMIDAVIFQIASKEIDNNKINEVFNANLITFKSRSSNESLCDLLDKYENLDDLSEVRNDNSKDMSPLKRCAVGGAIGLELRYNEDSRKARLLERRKKLELLRQQAIERKERLAREKREQDLIAKREESERLKNEEEAKRLAAEQRIAELEAALKEEEARRLAAEKALEEAPKFEEIKPLEEVNEENISDENEEEVLEEFGEDEIVTPEYVDAVVHEEVEVEENREVTYMAFETVEEEAYTPIEEEEPIEEPIEEPVIEEEVEEVEEVVEEEVNEQVVEEPKEEPAPVEDEPKEEEPKVEPVRCPVKKMHIIGWIITILVVATLACLYFFVPSFKETVTKLLDSETKIKTADYAVLFGLSFVGFGIVAFIIRTIIHAIRCKAKKGVACCKVCEIYKYLWAHLVVTLVAAFAFIKANLFHFNAVAIKVGNILQKILNKEDLTDGQTLIALALIFVTAYVLTLLVCSIAHLIRRKKGCKPGVVRHFIIYCWTLTIITIVEGVALLVLYPWLLNEIVSSATSSISSVLFLSVAPLVVNASANNAVANTSPSVVQIAFSVIFIVVVVYLLGLIGLTIGYSSHVKKKKAQTETANTEVEEKELEETPVVEEKVEEVVEEEEERLLFTTFEEAKLVEDLNDLNRMIGKVNEHVKDLSAIQARLYNELVGEEEIIVEPPVQEEHVVIPETPVEEVKVEEELVEEEPKEEPIKKEKVKCPVRRGQAIGWIITLIFVVAVAVLYVIPIQPVKDILNKVWDVFKNNKVNGGTNIAYLGGTLFITVALLAFLVRTLIHPLVCKAKKGKCCLQRRENLGYLWTAFIIGVIIFAVLTINNWHGFKDILIVAWDRVGKFDFGNFKAYEWGICCGALAIALFVISLIAGTISSGVKASKKSKAHKQEQVEDQKVVEEDLNTPLESKEEVEESSKEIKEEEKEPSKKELKAAKKAEKKAKKAERKANRPKCKVRKMQKVWLVITLVLLVAAVVVYYVVPSVKTFVDTQWALYIAPLGIWKTTDFLILYGAVVLVVLIVSFLVRFILHPLGCKARKHKHCCKVCEFHKYLWTVVFVGAGTLALLITNKNDVLNFNTFYGNAVKLLVNVKNNLNLTYLASLSLNQKLLLSGLVVAVIGLIVLIIVTFTHLANDRRRAKYIAKEEKEAKELAEKPIQPTAMYNPYMASGMVQPIYIYPQMNNNVPMISQPVVPYANPYTPGMYEDIESPYNMYRVNRSTAVPTYHSNKVLGFFKFLGVVVVLALAYAVCAYFIQALPLHEQITNLLKNIF